MNNTKNFIESSLRTDLPEIKIGYTIKIYYKFTEKGKERTQPFEGVIIAKRGSDISETMTIRGSVSGIMIERIIPVHSPNIENIKIIKKGKVRRAKLYYLRTAIGKRLRLKRKDDKKPSIDSDDQKIKKGEEKITEKNEEEKINKKEEDLELKQ